MTKNYRIELNYANIRDEYEEMLVEQGHDPETVDEMMFGREAFVHSARKNYQIGYSEEVFDEE